MSEVFISYSRRDAGFAAELVAALEARGKRPWLDVEGIADGEVFPDVLRRAIDESDGFVFVISEDSVRSPFCRQEIDHAERGGKRIVPVLHRPVPDALLPTAIRDRQWVNAGAQISTEAADRLVRALDTDLDHTRRHARLLVRAREWEAAGRRASGLLRGDDLAQAEAWLTRAPHHQPRPTALHTEWIAAARAAAARRQRRLVAGAATVALVAAGLLVFALLSRHEAVRAEDAARSEALAGEAENQVAQDPQRALLIARAALAAAPTAAAQLATSEALDANTARSQLPSFGAQGCVDANYMYLLDGGRTAIDNTCGGDVVFGDLRARRIVRRLHVGPASTDMTIDGMGRSLTVATGDRLVAVTVSSGRMQAVLRAPFSIEWIAHGSSPGRIAVASRDTVLLAGPDRGRERVIARGDLSADPILGMFWTSPTVLLVVTGGQTAGRGDLFPGLTLLDVVRGTRATVRLTAPPLAAAVAFLGLGSNGRTWYVTGSEDDPRSGRVTAATWAIDARSRHLRWVAHGPDGAQANPVQDAPDSRLVAVGYSQGAVDVLNAATGRLVVRHTSSSSIVAGWMAFPPGDRTLVTVTLDGVYRTWSATGGELLRAEIPVSPAVGFTPDGTRVLAVGNRGEELRVANGAVLRRFPGFPAAAVFNTCPAACFSAVPGLARLSYVDPAAATPRVRMIDGTTGRPRGAVTVPRLDAQAVTPDGRLFVVAVDGDRLTARLVDRASGSHRSLPTATSSAGCVAATPSVTPDGRLAAVVDGCLDLTVWDLVDGRIVRTVELPDRAGGTPAQLTADGHAALLVAEGGGIIRTDVRTGVTTETPGTDPKTGVIAISPDGRFYAVGRQDGTFDEYDGRGLRLVRHHALLGPIVTVVFSPDSRSVAVEDSAGVLRVFDTCDICEDSRALADRAARESVRVLNPAERAAFGVP